jgi:hypothetical protein
MAWSDLFDTYSAAGVVPVLGAGVSVGSRSLIGASCSAASRNVARRPAIRHWFKNSCAKATVCPRSRACYARCVTRTEFTEFVREELYRDFKNEVAFSGRAEPSKNGLLEFVRSQNHTLKSVAALCAVESNDGKTFLKNPRIRAIVNFNIDDVFREYVQARYRRALVRTIERPSKEPHRNRVSVYYMHGFLRFDDKAGDQKKEASDKLVLAEHEYFDFFNNPTGLFNHTFLYLMREHCCLFIGLSMRDDNIRRLLHYSTKERVRLI